QVVRLTKGDAASRQIICHIGRGVPFREAYNLVGQVVRQCLATHKLLKDLTLTEWQQLHPAFEADIYEAIAPHQVVAARNSFGGTGFDQVRQALSAVRKRLTTE
ncbi:MAG: hypothetical protein AAFO87_03930, partial [Cyanobacteria bacterium J06607_6]